MPTIALHRPLRSRSTRGGAPVRRRSGDAVPRRAHDRRQAAVPRTFGARVLDARLLEVLIARRLWIPVLAAALIGIVAIQVTTLGVNARISRSVERASLLQRENTALASTVSRLESSVRLQEAVARMGMVDSVAGSRRYLHAASGAIAAADGRQIALLARRGPLPPVPVVPAAAPGTVTAQAAAAAPGQTPATTALVAQAPAMSTATAGSTQ